MTSEEMLTLLQERTKVSTRSRLLNELRAAFRWVGRRVYNSANGPDLCMVPDEEVDPLTEVTRTLDLGILLQGGTIFGIKQLWVKLPGDVRFEPMVERDLNDPLFIANDSEAATDTTAAKMHPVYYYVYNFSSVRFSPALPIDAVIRADYFCFPIPPDPDDSDSDSVTEEEASFEIFQDAILHKAGELLFSGIDDARELLEKNRAQTSLDEAIYNAERRAQGPTRIQPYRRRGRR